MIMLSPAKKAAPAKARAKARKMYFTAANVLGLRREQKQYLVWDSNEGKDRSRPAAKGLAVLVSPGGSKSLRSAFYFRDMPDQVNYLNLGRLGSLLPYDDAESYIEHVAREIEYARRRTDEARHHANPKDDRTREVKDPRGDRRKSGSVETAIRDYIKDEQIGRRANRSAGQVQTIMLARCAEWLPRPITSIKQSDVNKLLRDIRDGVGRKPSPSMSVRLHSHLSDFFKWCRREKLIALSPMEDVLAPATLAKRSRFYSGDELKAIWTAAEALGRDRDGIYVKLAMLLALRRNELALARWSEFDDPANPTLFVVPTERVKLMGRKAAAKRPVYRIPLPPLSQELLNTLKREGELVFPKLDADGLKNRLAEHGAPTDFKLHVFRDTIATWLENNGRSEWERGLVLNHSKGNSVTAGYSHGHATDLKRQMLTEWEGHIRSLVGMTEAANVLNFQLRS